jgi:XTP/dITP diphosphohydrolase
MKELLIATGNKGKMKEFAALLAALPIKLYSFNDFPDFIPPPENGKTFAENAVIKATAAMLATGLPTIADDSGLCVEALGCDPGVFSARYAGVGATDADNNAKLLQELAGTPAAGRRAAFRCVIALCCPEGEPLLFNGELNGLILETSAGAGGFGYDPLFMVPEYGKTLAELPLEIKNRISHRGRATAALKEFLKADLTD